MTGGRCSGVGGMVKSVAAAKSTLDISDVNNDVRQSLYLKKKILNNFFKGKTNKEEEEEKKNTTAAVTKLLQTVVGYKRRMKERPEGMNETH